MRPLNATQAGGAASAAAAAAAGTAPKQGGFASRFWQRLWAPDLGALLGQHLLLVVVSVGLATLIAVPLAYLTVRFEFRGALLIQTLGVLPLIMPPFVGAVALQLIFGRSGSVNLLLNDWFDITIPIMDGLVGVTFVESIHYFPFILLNLVALAIVMRVDYENKLLMRGGRV